MMVRRDGSSGQPRCPDRSKGTLSDSQRLRQRRAEMVLLAVARKMLPAVERAVVVAVAVALK